MIPREILKKIRQIELRTNRIGFPRLTDGSGAPRTMASTPRKPLAHDFSPISPVPKAFYLPNTACKKNQMAWSNSGRASRNTGTAIEKKNTPSKKRGEAANNTGKACNTKRNAAKNSGNAPHDSGSVRNQNKNASRNSGNALNNGGSLNHLAGIAIFLPGNGENFGKPTLLT